MLRVALLIIGQMCTYEKLPDNSPKWLYQFILLLAMGKSSGYHKSSLISGTDSILSLVFRSVDSRRITQSMLQKGIPCRNSRVSGCFNLK